MESNKPLLAAMKEVLLSEWLLVITRSLLFQLLKKLEFLMKTGNQAKEITLLCKEKSSDNSLEDSSTKEPKKNLMRLLETWKTSN